jgi:4-alpha-glucanotransferase
MQPIRSSGVLLHLSSLPGPHGSGDMGPDALYFLDWLQAAGQSWWQFLPLNGIGLGHSPYMSPSAFGGNVLLIDLAELQQRGWLSADALAPLASSDGRWIDFEVVIDARMAALAQAHAGFLRNQSEADRQALQAFKAAQSSWLDDYALFMALTEHWAGQVWMDWPAPLARREAAALEQARVEHAARMEFWAFCQWTFFRQWQALREQAHQRGVQLLGDVPIFIAQHSAEVWARPELFDLNADGRPRVVAGVPPDGFSAEGQRWGNPLYRWATHRAEGYAWWIERMRWTLSLVDQVRIDHFRGFESYWEIGAHEPTAQNGRWVTGPGAELFQAMTSALGPLPVVAEDLGVITPQVTALRRQLGLPGMRVLQFAWGEDQEDAHHQPHRYESDTVAYPGTHDNDTTLGWWASAPEPIRQHVRDYLACDGNDVGWSFIRAAWASVAQLAICPLQDVLRLSGEHRMNQPGSPQGNWAWRFLWSDVKPEHAGLLRRLTQLYERLPKK